MKRNILESREQIISWDQHSQGVCQDEKSWQFHEVMGVSSLAGIIAALSSPAALSLEWTISKLQYRNQEIAQ